MAGSDRLPFISTVIPAYNEEKFLPQCLASLARQNYPGNYEVIVVDNASTDGTASVASSLGARVVYEPKRSPACARQKGLLVARGDIVAFLDADTQAPPHWLLTIARHFARKPGTVAVSGPYAFCDAGPLTRCLSYAFNFFSISVDGLIRRALRRGGPLWGSNFAVRREALLRAGGFDTTIKFLGEDYELSLRLSKLGQLGLLPRLFVLTSARRLKQQGLLATYWNYIVNYFSVLLYCRPIPERLENWPSRARGSLDESPAWQRYGSLAGYSGLGLLLVLLSLWLSTWRSLGPFQLAIYLVEAMALLAVLVHAVVSPTSQLCGRVLGHGSRSRRNIALTFDDGPNEPYTSQVLDILHQYGVRATFFLVGQNVERHPQVCLRLLAQGHVLANHSYSHPRRLCLQRSRDMAQELGRCQEAIYQAAGYRTCLFRPPHGYRSPWLLRTAERLGYAVVTWDVMTSDWRADKPAEETVRAILRRVKPGSILVLHDGRSTHSGYDRSQMLRALPRIVEGLQQQGFDFVPLPALLGQKAEALAAPVS